MFPAAPTSSTLNTQSAVSSLSKQEFNQPVMCVIILSLTRMAGDGVQTSGPGAGRWWRGCVLSWPGAGADWGLAPGSGVLVAHWASSLHNVQYHHNISGHHFIITSSKSGNHCIFTIRQRHKFRHFWNHLPPFFLNLSPTRSR